MATNIVQTEINLSGGDVGKSKKIVEIALDKIRLSRFNTRKSRSSEQLEKLSDRIKRNGFEITRAVWVYEVDGFYEAFAGGTRFEAAKLAGLDKISCVLHEDFTDAEISRLADEDNENDEYHAKVPILDVWAEYYRLWKEEGWTQQQIADAKGCSKSQVSERISFHSSLPEVTKKACSDELFDEGHCQAILSVFLTSEHLSLWLTTTQAQTELTKQIRHKHRGLTKEIKPTVANVREAAKEWKEFISKAEFCLNDLPEEYRELFVQKLKESKARSLSFVVSAYNEIQKAIAGAKRKQEEDLKARQSQAEQERIEAERDERKAIAIQAFMGKIQHGDAKDLISECPNGFRLLLTDPPYGMDFQSGRRVATAKKAKIANDDESIFELLGDVFKIAYDRADENATALVFCTFKSGIENRFCELLDRAGFKIRNSLVWVKNNHGTGDLDRDFAPKHERIIHATKGDPKLNKRIPDVVYGKDDQNSRHPAEKPIDLLAQLIEATTTKDEIVIDPFAGSGSSLIASHRLGRDFWGCEIDSDWFNSISNSLLKIVEQGI